MIKTRSFQTILVLILFFLGALLVLGSAEYSIASQEESGHGEEAAHGEGAHEETWVQVIGRWFNFIVLVAILYYFLKKSLRIQDRFKNDYDQIQSSIESARLAKEEAESKLKELDARMVQVTQDIEQMKVNAAREAEAEKQRILDSAQKEAERIVELAHREIDSQVEIATKQLRKQVAELAVTRGREIIQKEIVEKDQKQLIQDYIKGFDK